MSRARDFADLAGSADAGGLTGRNLIINGAMLINQRGSVTAASGTAVTYGGVDRWRIYKQDSTAVLDISQSTDVPSGQGFKYSYKVDVTTADSSAAADDRCDVIFRWEGQDLQHLKKGTSEALATTLSFWVKSSKTGTHICEMFDNDNSRQISKVYTVNTADTWEHKTITFEGDTTGALAADNGNSMQISWWLMAGSNTAGGTLSTTWTSNTQANRAVGQVNVLDSTSNEWYITGVQLEVGNTATAFEHRSYADELARCQRYFQHWNLDGTYQGGGGFPGMLYSVDLGFVSVPFMCEMRAAPTGSISAANTWQFINASDSPSNVNSVSVYSASKSSATVQLDPSSSGSTPVVANTSGGMLWPGNTNTNDATISMDAEL